MRLIIRGHPELRMRQRGVTREDIERALSEYTTSWPSNDENGRIVYIGPGISGAALKVVLLHPGYIDDETAATVVTTAWVDEEG
ncbi:MAG: hypothetical protein WB797_02360 [Nocardioides sp.]